MNVRERLPEYIYPPKIYRNFWSESVLAELQTLINDFYNDKLLLRLQYTFWAKNLWKDKIRIARKPKLEELDVEFTKAQEAGSDTSAIVAKKKDLRDFPAQVDSKTTLDEIKTVWDTDKLGDK